MSHVPLYDLYLVTAEVDGESLFTMLSITVLVLVSYAFAQSLISSSEGNSRSNTCLRRSVLVYTQDSSTYVVTNLGSTSFTAAPTFCPNVSVSTSTIFGSNRTVTKALPASTVTVYDQSISTPSSASTVITDDGFENGDSNPFNTTASSPQVTAQVAQSGPLQPYSGNSYL